MSCAIPSHGLVPLAAGAAATAVAGVGMAIIQFLLGVDAPVSWLLLQQIFITVLVNTIIALPVYAIVKRSAHPGAARGPAPPSPPRVHDRRPERRCRARHAASARFPARADDRSRPMTPTLPTGRA